MRYFETANGYYYKENAKGEKTRVSQREYSKKRGGTPIRSPPANNSLNQNTSRRVNRLNVRNQVTINSLYRDPKLAEKLPEKQDLNRLLSRYRMDLETYNKILIEIKEYYLAKYHDYRHTNPATQKYRGPLCTVHGLISKDKKQLINSCRDLNKKSVIERIIKDVEIKKKNQNRRKAVNFLQSKVNFNQEIRRHHIPNSKRIDIELRSKCKKLDKRIENIQRNNEKHNKTGKKILHEYQIEKIVYQLIPIKKELKKICNSINDLVNTHSQMNIAVREHALRRISNGYPKERINLLKIEDQISKLEESQLANLKNDNLERRLAELKK